MWNLFCVMQVLAYAQNFILWPAVAQMVITQIIDAIYLKKVNDMIMDFGMSKYEAAKSSTKDAFKKEQGIVDDSLMRALGIFFIAVILVGTAVGIFFCLRACRGNNCCARMGEKIRNKLRQKLFYSGPIRYVIVGYLKLFNQFLTSAALGIVANDLMGLVYLVPILLLVLFPVWLVWHLISNSKKLNEADFKSKFGSLYSGLKTDSFRALCLNAVFAMRRIDIVVMNVFLSEGSPISGIDRSMYLQKIICFLYIQMLYLMFIHNVRPHSENLFNRLEFINEYLMMGVAYCMINFANVVSIQDPVTHEPLQSDSTLNSAIELLSITFIGLIVLVNFGVMIVQSVRKIQLYFKKRKALQRHKEAMLEREKSKANATQKKMLTAIPEEKEEDDLEENSPSLMSSAAKFTLRAAIHD